MKVATETECASAPWLSTAPLGKPVVPEVNSTTAPSSGSMSSGANSSPSTGADSAEKSTSRPGRSGFCGLPTTIRGQAGSGRFAEMISSRSASRIATLQPALSIARSISSATPRLLTSAATPPIDVTAIRLNIHSGRLLITTATVAPRRTPNCSRKALASAAARAKPSA